jgi:hypothetical protein
MDRECCVGRDKRPALRFADSEGGLIEEWTGITEKRRPRYCVVTGACPSSLEIVINTLDPSLREVPHYPIFGYLR